MHSAEARRVVWALLLCLLTLPLAGTPAMAFDLGQWVPGLKVSPFLSQKVEYQSNVFQVPSHSQDDVIFKTIPGVLADYTFGSHSLTAGYRAEILNYLNLTSQNTVNHIAVGQLRLDFPRTLLTVKDDFIRTNDPPNTELTGPIESNTNVLKTDGEYRLTPSFSAGLNHYWTPRGVTTFLIIAGDAWLLALCYWLMEVRRWQLPWLVALGQTALVLYFVHQLIEETLIHRMLGLRFNNWILYWSANIALIVLCVYIGRLWQTVKPRLRTLAGLAPA